MVLQADSTQPSRMCVNRRAATATLGSLLTPLRPRVIGAEFKPPVLRLGRPACFLGLARVVLEGGSVP